MDKSYRKFINDCDNYANEKMKTYSKNNIKNRKYSKVEDYAQDNKAQKEKYKRQFAKKYFQEYLAEDIKNFDDMGLELTVGWLK